MTSNQTFIEVTEFRAIGGEQRNWELLKRNKKLDKETKQPIGGYTEWVAYSYPSSFESACAKLEQELIRTCGAQTFTELRRMAERIHAMMLETLEAAKLPGIGK